MQLKPQDFLVSLKIAVMQIRREKCSYQQLALSCGLSVSDAHASVQRAHFSRLLNAHTGARTETDAVIGNFTAHLPSLVEFGIHGLKFVWPAKDGPPRLGMPTGAAVVADELGLVQSAGIQVWPTEDGEVQGVSLEPWHPALPAACQKDADLHRLAAILEVIRTGGARAVDQAKKAFDRCLSPTLIRRIAS